MYSKLFQGEVVSLQNYTHMDTEVIRSDHPSAVQHAFDVLNQQGLVAFPTDTVYGLAAYPFDNEHVQRLFSAKGRSSSKAIAVLISDVGSLDNVCKNINETTLTLARYFWPGPLTLVVEKHPLLATSLTPHTTVGVRIPNHPVALALLKQTGPLAVTSANMSGDNNLTSADQVYTALKGRIHLVLDGGPIPGGVPSTVVDCTNDKIKILRPGPISEEDLFRELARKIAIG